MTMSDFKATSAAEFNLYITDDFTREYFLNAFDLWSDCACFYDGSNGAYKAVIKRYAPEINAGIQTAEMLLSTAYTKKTSGLNTNLTQEISTVEKSEIRTETDGEFTQTARQYPDGYIAAPDTAYIQGQTHNSEFEQSHTLTGADNAQKDGQASATAESVEVDIIARANALAAYKPIYGLVERLVFEFVDFGRTKWH